MPQKGCNPQQKSEASNKNQCSPQLQLIVPSSTMSAAHVSKRILNLGHDSSSTSSFTKKKQMRRQSCEKQCRNAVDHNFLSRLHEYYTSKQVGPAPHRSPESITLNISDSYCFLPTALTSDFTAKNEQSHSDFAKEHKKPHEHKTREKLSTCNSKKSLIPVRSPWHAADAGLKGHCDDKFQNHAIKNHQITGRLPSETVVIESGRASRNQLKASGLNHDTGTIKGNDSHKMANPTIPRRLNTFQVQSNESGSLLKCCHETNRTLNMSALRKALTTFKCSERSAPSAQPLSTKLNVITGNQNFVTHRPLLSEQQATFNTRNSKAENEVSPKKDVSGPKKQAGHCSNENMSISLEERKSPSRPSRSLIPLKKSTPSCERVLEQDLKNGITNVQSNNPEESTGILKSISSHKIIEDDRRMRCAGDRKEVTTQLEHPVKSSAEIVTSVKQAQQAKTHKPPLPRQRFRSNMSNVKPQPSKLTHAGEISTKKSPPKVKFVLRSSSCSSSPSPVIFSRKRLWTKQSPCARTRTESSKKTQSPNKHFKQTIDSTELQSPKSGSSQIKQSSSLASPNRSVTNRTSLSTEKNPHSRQLTHKSVFEMLPKRNAQTKKSNTIVCRSQSQPTGTEVLNENNKQKLKQQQDFSVKDVTVKIKRSQTHHYCRQKLPKRVQKGVVLVLKDPKEDKLIRQKTLKRSHDNIANSRGKCLNTKGVSHKPEDRITSPDYDAVTHLSDTKTNLLHSKGELDKNSIQEIPRGRKRRYLSAEQSVDILSPSRLSNVKDSSSEPASKPSMSHSEGKDSKKPGILYSKDSASKKPGISYSKDGDSKKSGKTQSKDRDSETPEISHSKERNSKHSQKSKSEHSSEKMNQKKLYSSKSSRHQGSERSSEGEHDSLLSASCSDKWRWKNGRSTDEIVSARFPTKNSLYRFSESMQVSESSQTFNGMKFKNVAWNMSESDVLIHCSQNRCKRKTLTEDKARSSFEGNFRDVNPGVHQRPNPENIDEILRRLNRQISLPDRLEKKSHCPEVSLPSRMTQLAWEDQPSDGSEENCSLADQEHLAATPSVATLAGSSVQNHVPSEFDDNVDKIIQADIDEVLTELFQTQNKLNHRVMALQESIQQLQAGLSLIQQPLKSMNAGDLKWEGTLFDYLMLLAFMVLQCCVQYVLMKK